MASRGHDGWKNSSLLLRDLCLGPNESRREAISFRSLRRYGDRRYYRRSHHRRTVSVCDRHNKYFKPITDAEGLFSILRCSRKARRQSCHRSEHRPGTLPTPDSLRRRTWPLPGPSPSWLVSGLRQVPIRGGALMERPEVPAPRHHGFGMLRERLPYSNSNKLNRLQFESCSAKRKPTPCVAGSGQKSRRQIIGARASGRYPILREFPVSTDFADPFGSIQGIL